MRHICNVTAEESMPNCDKGKPREMRQIPYQSGKGMFAYIFPL